MKLTLKATTVIIIQTVTILSLIITSFIQKNTITRLLKTTESVIERNKKWETAYNKLLIQNRDLKENKFQKTINQ